MKTFWQLYKKEVRFLAGPGIGFIVLSYVRMLLGLRMRYIDDAVAYIFGALLLYSLIHEHLTRSSYQLSMLPIRRSIRVAAKYCAVISWAILYIPQGLVYAAINANLSRFIPAIYWPGWGDPRLIINYVSSNITEAGFVCALVVLGYTAALAVRPLKYITGPVAVIAGYMSRERIQTPVTMYLKKHFPTQGLTILETPQGIVEQHGPILQLGYFDSALSLLLATIILLTIGMILSERYAEV